MQEPQENLPRLSYYRFVYAKAGALRFLGNRDMMDIFHRAFIAADIPLAYSQGYHPHPKIAFAPPLPFGVIGLAELFDIVTIQDVSPERLFSINQWLPNDLKIRKCLPLSKKEESLNAVIAGAEYVFAPTFSIDASALSSVAQQALLKNEILIPSKESGAVNNRLAIKNIRPYIYKLEVIDNALPVALSAILSLSPQAMCRPSELIIGLFPDRLFTDFLVYRTECLKKEADELITLWKDSI
jgi:radical SAM-linked protein